MSPIASPNRLSAAAAELSREFPAGSRRALYTEAMAQAFADLGYVSVKDYGAKGNGITDDAAAIQAAVDAIPDRGGIVYFPPGIYQVNSDIVPASIGTQLSRDVVKPILFLGASVGRQTDAAGFIQEGVSVIHYGGSGNLFDFRLGTDADTFWTGGIRDLVMIGSASVGDGTRGIYADFMTTAGTIQNVGIRQFDTNIEITGDCWKAVLENIFSERAKTDNLVIHQQPNGLTIRGGNFERAERDNIRVLASGTSGVRLEGTYVQTAGQSGSGVGLHILDGGEGPIQCIGCHFEANVKDIVVDGAGGTQPFLNLESTSFFFGDDSPRIEVRNQVRMFGVYVDLLSAAMSPHAGFIGRLGSSNPSVIAIGSRVQSDVAVPLLTFDPGSLAYLCAVDDMMAEDDTKIGHATVIQVSSVSGSGNAMPANDAGAGTSIYNTERNVPIVSDGSSWIHLLAGSANREALAGAKQLSRSDARIQNLDPNGGNRNVDLPPEQVGLEFVIGNRGSGGNTLTIRDDSGVATFVTLSNDDVAIASCDGTGWVVFKVAGATS